MCCSTLTADLLLQIENDVDGLMEDEQFGLWFVRTQVQLTHTAQLLKGLVDVAHSQPLACVIGHAPLFVTFLLHLCRQVFIILIVIFTELKNERDSFTMLYLNLVTLVNVVANPHPPT